MISWIRVVFPPNLIGLVLIVYVLSQAVLWSAGELNNRLVGFELVCLGAVYGFYRVFAYHPVLRPGYLTWLKQTPWAPARALPLGPIHLVLQDLAIASLLTLLGMPVANFPPFAIPLAMLAAYLTLMCVTFVCCGVHSFAYLMAFGLALLLRFVQHLEIAWIIAGGLLLISIFGLRRSLATYSAADCESGGAAGNGSPWKMFNEWMGMLNLELKPSLGWPYDWMLPAPVQKGISALHGALVSILMGWWTYAVLYNVDMDDRTTVGSTCVGMTGLFLTLGRVFLYIPGYRPPIALWGRILTGRWIIPGYDKVFVAPMLIVAVALTALRLLDGQRFAYPEIVCGVAMMLVFMAALVTGPQLWRWRLIGNHRICPGLIARANTSEPAKPDTTERLVEV